MRSAVKGYDRFLDLFYKYPFLALNSFWLSLLFVLKAQVNHPF
jgi:hypothetical protein